MVAPNAGGVTTLANSENAWTVEPDVESFSNAIQEALQDSELKEKKTKNALTTVEAYRWETVAAGFLDLYAQFHNVADGESSLTQPDFRSTAASRSQAALLHVISQTVRRAFLFGADMISLSEGRSRRRDSRVSRRSLTLRFRARP